MDAETFRYTIDGELFVPKIAESLAAYDPALGYNGAVIPLDARLDSDLKWEPVDFDGYILWKFHFGDSLPDLTDEVVLNSYKLALEHFCEMVLPKYEKSIGVVLYEGSARIWDQLIFTENLKEQLGDEPIETFSLSLLSEYLHLLGAVLPDGLPAFAFFDCEGVVQPLQLFSKERFPHIELGLKGVDFPVFGLRWNEGRAVGGFVGSGKIPEVAPPETKRGVVIPEGKFYFSEIELALKKHLDPYRLIFESTITTSWDELAELECFKLSPMGERMVEGFVAAGGKKLRGRGI